MKRLFTLGLSALLLLAAQAQTARQFMVPLTPDSAAFMDAFLPEYPSGRAVVCCPGGAYERLAFNHEGRDWAPFFNEQGIALFVLHYRMPHGNRDLPLSDACAAIRTVRDSARVWQTNDVGIMGFSAGGHLASSVATHAPLDVRPDFQILFYPVITMRDGTHAGSRNNFLGAQPSADLLNIWSNELQARKHDTPPAIIFQSNDDAAVPALENAVAYYTSLRRQGIDASLHVYPTGGHGWGFNAGFAYHTDVLASLRTWLANHPPRLRDAVRIACLGNSITAGSGIDFAPSNAYPAHLQRLLGAAYDVRNFGLSARTLLNKGDYPYMAEPLWQDVQRFCPDVAIVKLGTNDSKPNNWDEHKDEFLSDYQQLIDTLRALPSQPRVLLVLPLKAYNRNFKLRGEVIQGEIIPLIRQLAQKNKLEIIDLNTPSANHPEWYQPDGIHPHADGSRHMAEVIREQLLK